MRLVAEALLKVALICLPFALIAPIGGHMRQQAGAGPGTADLVDVVQAIGAHQIFSLAQIPVVGMQVGLSK